MATAAAEAAHRFLSKEKRREEKRRSSFRDSTLLSPPLNNNFQFLRSYFYSELINWMSITTGLQTAEGFRNINTKINKRVKTEVRARRNGYYNGILLYLGLKPWERYMRQVVVRGVWNLDDESPTLATISESVAST
uniref:Uncharacterized protein n=1 Tax=Vespula pensylvanica TaxID=30213 RepID=A0A834NZA4_VESPE|nr:hypothetical protein H0235_009434 [Vespula pensylvanica]